jgi:benzoylformate decarboxylase
VHVDEPARAQDVPGALVRARHEAVTRRGPALVVVPMDDWLAPAPESHERIGPARLLHGRAPDVAALDELASTLAGARAPALVVGAGVDSPAGWAATGALAERLACPVWQESFGARAGFPQDHPAFAGHLPADRARLRDVLAGYDLVLVVGAPVFRQYPYAEGPLTAAGNRVVAITDDPDEAHRSPAELALLADPAETCRALAVLLGRSARPPVSLSTSPAPLAEPAAGERLRAAHLLDALAARLPADAIVVEETPSSRPDLHARLPARAPLGFVSAAMGGLGFALPGATGLRMARADRPVVAIVGDGSAMYGVQALWSAARYGVGALFVVLENGGYAVMDRLAERHGGTGPWPRLDGLDIGAIARGFGCPARRVETHADLVAVLDELVPGLRERSEPLLLEVAVEPDATFEP